MLDIGEKEFSKKISADKWSKKQILGHLIDSAANNHQRFVRCQFEVDPIIVYDQNKWNQFSYYPEMDVTGLIFFWQYYNKHLSTLLKLIPAENLKRGCRVAENKVLSLEFLIGDYVVHMEHHLKQIVNYI